jgi:CBS domain containing-hemolysin-like protein
VPATSWGGPGIIILKLLAVILLVLLNGFFVASEFAIVKVRASQLDALVVKGTRAVLNMWSANGRPIITASAASYLS